MSSNSCIYINHGAGDH